MKNIVKKLAHLNGLETLSIQKHELLTRLDSDSDALLDLVLQSRGVREKSRAQLKQDVFVLLATNFKKEGFFVEFGATNGIDLSNTYLLEKAFDWRGVLAEPAKIWHDDLAKNRRAKIEHSCVWSRSDEVLKFNMVDDPEFSTIASMSDKDCHSEIRRQGEVYEVQTISLSDLLDKHDAPEQIDYLSIDTEGSEFEILESFDFSSRNISIITCEHNYSADREKIQSLMSRNGYGRKFEGYSKWDDWYFKSTEFDNL